jgi:hypothetical protein
MRPGRAVASFDSATGMLRALSRFLAGQDTPLIGQAPAAWEPLLSGVLGGVNRLPSGIADRIYALSGVSEAVPRRRIGEVRSEELASWVVDHYPRRRYPVIFVGSSNGALIHLAAALGVPWLPQTLLIPVRRRGVHPDDAAGEMRAGLEPGRALLDANPDLTLHHMHDPNQDRLMITGMSYFRVKWRRMPEPYRRFVRDCLAPGGVLIAVDCGLRWPTTRISDRHLFQFGALGGATIREYHEGGPRVRELLARYRSPRLRWDPPAPSGESPEAEWGFEPELLADLGDLAAEQHGDLRRLGFADPERLSPAIADLYRSWYADRGLPDTRLLGESFLLIEPWWTLRTGSVPYWLVFNTEASWHALRDYLASAAPYDEIRLMLFSHGADSIGLASIDDWRHLTKHARKIGALAGVDPDAYPRDFASLARAHRAVAQVRDLHPMPPPMKWDMAESALRQHPQVSWTGV